MEVKEKEATEAEKQILVHFIPGDGGTRTNIDRRV